MKIRSLLALVLTLIAPAVFAQRDFANVKFQAVRVTTNLFFLQASGTVVGNIGVFTGPEGILLVDDGYGPLADKTEAAVKKLNPGKISGITNTQSEAVDQARSAAQRDGVELYIHRPDGRIRDRDSHGHDP